jgi:hypothetical protein
MNYFVTTEEGDSLDVMNFETPEELLEFSSKHPELIFEEIEEFYEIDDDNIDVEEEFYDEE